MTIFYIVLLFIAAYFMGAPLGYYLVKLKTGKDIRFDFRDVGGSSSSGATNVKRAMGNRWAFFVAFCDYLKGATPTAIAVALWGTYWVVGLIGLTSLLGNLFPVLVSKPRFKGGKGVATTGGALTPMVAISLINYHPLWLILLFFIILLLWGIFVWILRRENHKWMVLASSFLVSAMILFFGIMEAHTYPVFTFSVYLMGIIVLCAHYENWVKLKNYFTTRQKSPGI
ncbi:MAG: glycerol-3-phosphate acyltransferase [Candidatus Pacebacteria bacterium]|nr:glycerol-3-phosphate acyltransferase [Candidatus Paceibacterota bacterium]